MSLEQQEARVIEAPKSGWVVWLSDDAYTFIQHLLEDVVEAHGGAKDLARKIQSKLAADILEGIY